MLVIRVHPLFIFISYVLKPIDLWYKHLTVTETSIREILVETVSCSEHYKFVSLLGLAILLSFSQRAPCRTSFFPFISTQPFDYRELFKQLLFRPNLSKIRFIIFLASFVWNFHFSLKPLDDVIAVAAYLNSRNFLT